MMLVIIVSRSAFIFLYGIMIRSFFNSGRRIMHYVGGGACTCVGFVRASAISANIHCHAHSVSSKRVSEIVHVRSIVVAICICQKYITNVSKYYSMCHGLGMRC